MSWDVMLVSAKKNGDLGSLNKVLQLLKENVPEIDLSNPSHGFIDQKDLAIEFYIGNQDPVKLIMLAIHAVGTFEKIENMVENLCKKTTWRAKDTATGSYIC